MLTQAENSVQPQDHMAWETRGLIADRTTEHLSYSDRGVVVYRRLSKENIERVQQGLDPFGLIRDPHHERIDTNLMESIVQQREARAPDGAQPRV